MRTPSEALASPATAAEPTPSEPSWAKLQQIQARARPQAEYAPAERDSSSAGGHAEGAGMSPQPRGSTHSSRQASPPRAAFMPGIVLVPHGMARDAREGSAERRVDSRRMSGGMAEPGSAATGRRRTPSAQRMLSREGSPANRSSGGVAARVPPLELAQLLAPKHQGYLELLQGPETAMLSPNGDQQVRALTRTPDASDLQHHDHHHQQHQHHQQQHKQQQHKQRKLERSPSQERLAMYEDDLPSPQLLSHRLRSAGSPAPAPSSQAAATERLWYDATRTPEVIMAPDQQLVSRSIYSGRTGPDASSVLSPRLQGLQADSPRAARYADAAGASSSHRTARQPAAGVGTATRGKPRQGDASSALQADTFTPRRFTPQAMDEPLAALQRMNNARAADEHRPYHALASPRRSVFGVEPPEAVRQQDPRYQQQQQQKQMLQYHFQQLQHQFELSSSSHANTPRPQAPQLLFQPSASHQHRHMDAREHNRDANMSRQQQPAHHQEQHMQQPKRGFISFDQYPGSGRVDSRYAAAPHQPDQVACMSHTRI